MQKFVDITQTQLTGPSFVTIGNFDGLHRGHQLLLRQLIEIAQQAFATGAVHAPPKSGLITFDPHPLAVLRPATPHYLLTTPVERLDLAAQVGIDFGIVQPFTPAIANLEAHEFLRLLKTHLGLAGLVVGPDFALGRGRKGDLATLQHLSNELNYTLHVIEPVIHSTTPVRSSIIRQALFQGDVATAGELLGRSYAVTSEVIPGDQRGRQIGIPTANLAIAPTKLLPADGVYATLARVQMADGERVFHSATNLGVRPTVEGLQRRLETHLIDFPPPEHSGDLYGQQLTIEFIARLRDEQRFATISALVAQIQADLARARQLLESISV